MSRPTARASSLAIGVTVAVVVAVGFALGLHLENLHNGVTAVAFTGVGLWVVWQRPGNREAWLFVATGAASGAMFAARQYGLHRPSLPGAAWIGWLGVWPLPLVFVLLAVTLMSFPTGRLPSPAWRPVVAGLAVLGVGLAAMSALWPVEYGRVPLSAPHPLDVPNADAAAAVHVWAAGIGYPLFQLVWVACVVWRLVRARGDEARQLRWFVYACGATAAVMAVGLIGWQSPLPGVLSAPLIPLAAGAAILRYRLYDIDPVINKTLVWGVMAAVVTLGYAAVVVGIGSLVGGRSTPLALLATALVAVAFEPLRRRVQRIADRIVYGRRATPYEALSRLSTQLTAPSGSLLDGLCATVAEGTGARQVVLWTGDRDTLRAVSAWPAGALAHGASADDACRLDVLERCAVVAPVAHNGRFVGAVAVTTGPRQSLTAAERRLLDDLAAQAGLVLELRASAHRLVVAGDEARRKLERDLHDGVQQRLVTVALELGGLVEAAQGACTPLAARAESARRQLLQATAELRETARGLHPSVLTQDGLEAALGYLADRSSIPVRLQVDVHRRLAPAVEATAYFVVSEGLTNAAKHAHATIAAVTAQLTADALLLEVSDNGSGGARPHPSSGLEGLADRLAVLDARLGIDSGSGGTRLRTVIPCA
jgi:signal transduction histidine kinase